MIIPDVNLLLYAHITAFPQHPKASKWWKAALSGPAEVGLPSVAIFGFLRIGTNRRAIDPPLAVEAALAIVRGWLARPGVRVLQAGPRHLEVAFQLLEQLGTAANLTTDAQLAAHAIEHQAMLYSNDADFGRFAGLRWANPLA
jgi:toxin-antitoxin system PIN domain toxin